MWLPTFDSEGMPISLSKPTYGNVTIDPAIIRESPSALPEPCVDLSRNSPRVKSHHFSPIRFCWPSAKFTELKVRPCFWCYFPFPPYTYQVFIKKPQTAEHRAQIAVRYSLRSFSYIIYPEILSVCSIPYATSLHKTDSNLFCLF